VTRLDSSGAAPAAGGAPRRCVLVVDDDERIRRVLERILGAHGIEANTAASGKEAVRMTASGAYDLVILDLLMPGEDGFSVLKDLARRDPDQAILVLSCLSDPESKVTSLGLGADDYVPKPFHVEELVARVQARLRAVARPGRPVLGCGRLRLDVLHRQADTGAGPVALTSREFQLLWELMRDPGAVLSKEELLARVWGSAPQFASNVVDVYVRRLRSRLGADVIATVRNGGYRVEPV